MESLGGALVKVSKMREVGACSCVQEEQTDGASVYRTGHQVKPKWETTRIVLDREGADMVVWNEQERTKKN